MHADGTRPPALAVVAIGASNLSRGLASLAATARSRSASPVDLFVAAGHGRSYGANSRVWMRRLPSILFSGIWRAIDRTSSGRGGPADGPRPLAVVTDIGNDLLYGFSVEQVAAWVDECLRRLEDRGFRSVVTRLPMASIATVGRLRYRALKTLYVPGCTLSLESLKSAAEDLDGLVAEAAARRGAAVLDQPGEWYGLDAIHVRRGRIRDLWSRVADVWELPSVEGRPRSRLGEWFAIGRRAAEVRSLAGIPRFTPQPAVTLRDRSRVWLY
jgi:hypothetical protein